MIEEVLTQICLTVFFEEPKVVQRCGTGQGNYVYMVECAGDRYMIRFSPERNAYEQSVYWLRLLGEKQIPVPKPIKLGRMAGYEYMVLSYLEGEDIGAVYPLLSKKEKREIAKELVAIQRKVAMLTVPMAKPGWSWTTFIHSMLDRAEKRIAANGYFDGEKVIRLRQAMDQLDSYFQSIKPLCYLDDISTKNLLIARGKISGIIDIDWIGVGDCLTYVALTNMALLDYGFDTDYVCYLLEEMRPDAAARKAFLFYTLMYCVDFMGERGMRFLDKTVPVNGQVVHKLNEIYEQLWTQWTGQ